MQEKRGSCEEAATERQKYRNKAAEGEGRYAGEWQRCACTPRRDGEDKKGPRARSCHCVGTALPWPPLGTPVGPLPAAYRCSTTSRMVVPSKEGGATSRGPPAGAVMLISGLAAAVEATVEAVAGPSPPGTK